MSVDTFGDCLFSVSGTIAPLFTTAKFGSGLAATPSNPTVIGATANMAYTFGAALDASNGDNDGKLVHHRIDCECWPKALSVS